MSVQRKTAFDQGIKMMLIIYYIFIKISKSLKVEVYVLVRECVGQCVGRGTLHLYLTVGVVAKVGISVFSYALVGITPRSEYRRSGNARSVNTRGAHHDTFIDFLR